MAFQLLQPVVLVHDLPEHGLRAGDLGAIVEVHDENAFEVEFVKASGETGALVTLSANDVRAIEATDLVTVRTLNRSA